MLPITRRISNYNFYKGNNVRYIVIHDTGNRTDTASGNANHFNGGNRNSSAHYFVDDKSIYQVVEDFNGSWHCGDGYGRYGITNHNSIGIEMCRVNNSVTSTTESNTIELVKMLINKYGVSIDNVVRHYDSSRKNCPSSFNYDGKWTRWIKFKEKLSSIPNKGEDEIMIVGKEQTFGNNDYRPKNEVAYAIQDQYVYDVNGKALKINGKEFILRKGRKVVMWKAVKGNFVECYPADELSKAGYNGMHVYLSAHDGDRIAIPKLLGDRPIVEKIVEKVVEKIVEKPVEVNSDILLIKGDSKNLTKIKELYKNDFKCDII